MNGDRFPMGMKAGMARMLGFSLVELMISLTLGSLITIAAIQLLSVNQRTFATQQATSRVQEDGQLALRFLATDLRQAGYSGDVVANASGVVLAGGPPVSSDSDPFDTLVIQFTGQRDCQGTASATAVSITNAYAVNGNGELTCNGSLTAGGAMAILPGIEAFRVLYGVDTTEDGEVGPFRFVGAASAVALNRPVLAIRVGLLLSVDGLVTSSRAAQSWNVLDRSVNTSADNAMRRPFFTTVMLRNQNWESL